MHGSMRLEVYGRDERFPSYREYGPPSIEKGDSWSLDIEVSRGSPAHFHIGRMGGYLGIVRDLFKNQPSDTPEGWLYQHKLENP